jgi:hypothetical protein
MESEAANKTNAESTAEAHATFLQCPKPVGQSETNVATLPEAPTKETVFTHLGNPISVFNSLDSGELEKATDRSVPYYYL